MSEHDLKKKASLFQQMAQTAPADSAQRVQLQSELAALPADKQAELLKPPAPVQLSSSTQRGAVQMEEEGPPSLPDLYKLDYAALFGSEQEYKPPKGYSDALKTAAKAWLKTETGSLIVKKAKEFAFSRQGLPFTCVVGTGALAAMVANEMNLPIDSLKIDVTLGVVGNHEFKLEFKPIWKGPLTGPQEYGGMVTLNISDFVKTDSGVEPGKVAKDRELFLFTGTILKPDGKAPDSNQAVILVDSSNKPVKRDLTYPGNGDYKIKWWANPWTDDHNFKLVVIPGAGGPTTYQKVSLPINLRQYYVPNTHPHYVGNIIKLEKLGGGMQTMYFDYPVQ